MNLEDDNLEGKSIAIVAMGPSSQAWQKRCYNNDNYEFYADVVRKKMGELAPPMADRYKEILREAFGKTSIPDKYDDVLSRIADDFCTTPEQISNLEVVCQEFGRELTVSEIGEPFDEVWGINHMGKYLLKLDRLFVMDDLHREHARYTDMLQRDIPIFTSVAYPEFPTSVTYPISDVVNDLKLVIGGRGPYLTNSVVAAVAYAVHKKAKRLAIYGADFHYPGIDRSEEARANCEFILGIGHERGLEIEIAPGSTLMNMHKVPVVYGYDRQPNIETPEGTLVFNGKGWHVAPGTKPEA